jgi:hypothetical protein
MTGGVEGIVIPPLRSLQSSWNLTYIHLINTQDL